MRKIFTLCIFFLIGTVSNRTLFAAASGEIVGTVTDVITGEPLPGANVYIDGTAIGAASDLNGNYHIQRVPPGSYNLKVKYIGYEEMVIAINVSDKEITKINFQLEHVIVAGKTVTITAQAEGQMAAINQQITARNIKNVVAADRIQEIPDVNAAESLGRLPGVSILRSGGEAEKVAIRGLSPRFNNITVDGVQMTSTDERNRSVSLASIASNTLAGIEVSKAITPDMDGGAIGGSVNLKLREADEGMHAELRLQGGYNGHDNKYNDYKLTGLVSNRFFKNNLGIVFSLNAEQVNRGNDELQGSWSKEFDKSFPLNGEKLTLTDRKDLRKRLGATLVADYILPFGKVKFSNFANRLDKESIVRKITYPDQGRIGYNISETPEQTTDQIVNTLYGEFNILQTKIDVQFSHSLSSVESASHDWSFSQDNAISEDAITENGFVDARTLNEFANIDYMKTYLVTISKDNRDTKERDLTASLNWKVPFSFGNSIAGYLKMGGKYNHKSRDQNIDAFDSPIYDTHKFLSDVFREQIPEVVSTYAGANLNVLMADFIDEDFKVDNYLGGKYNFPLMPKMDILRQMYSIAVKEISARDLTWDYDTDKSVLNDYNGFEDLNAFYIMSELNLFDKKLMLLPGVRYEHEKHQYTAALYSYSENDYYYPDLVNDTTATSSNEFFLPMFHIRYQPFNWFNIRLAQTKTLTRPNFRDYTPLRVFNTTDKDVKAGIPSLKPATSWNTDINFSIYSNYIGLFTAGGFYKEIENMIWTTGIYIPKNENEEFGLSDEFSNVWYNIPTNNEHKSYVSGLEFDWQSNFWYLPEPLNGIVFNLNYSHINSETKYPFTISERIPGSRPPKFARIDTFSVADLEDQPADILNLSFGYDIGGFSVRLSFYWQTQTLTSREKEEIKNEYTENYRRWDLAVKQDLPWKGLKLFFNANNLIDTPDRRFQLNSVYPTYQEYYGRSFALGLRYVY